MSTDEETRHKLSEAIHDLLAGQPLEPAILASADALWNCIAYVHHASGHDVSEALAFVDRLAVSMKASIETHWGMIDAQQIN
ncbi:hypothetical protein [Maritimibacter sp. DP1N21-5]|uniref:hypothetical protein n=1 Tax=Maritimibacter sp. DP1N21-5 TaxID=2836867 RepID=UPI001C47CAA7|nr:hypothetical protein [Maritimibacter sp. DP1N21-5]MBV7408179.1 hypothetical protein [Maritimibacter sp. DP1N21-5]